jgi:archaellum biogenesis protein FlaJ (TadC family)
MLKRAKKLLIFGDIIFIIFLFALLVFYQYPTNRLTIALSFILFLSIQLGTSYLLRQKFRFFINNNVTDTDITTAFEKAYIWRILSTAIGLFVSIGLIYYIHATGPYAIYIVFLILMTSLSILSTLIYEFYEKKIKKDLAKTTEEKTN